MRGHLEREKESLYPVSHHCESQSFHVLDEPSTRQGWARAAGVGGRFAQGSVLQFHLLIVCVPSVLFYAS